MYEDLKKIIDNAEKIVFFGGAGVSTESGIPDFRGTGGLYRQNDPVFKDVSPERILSASFLRDFPEEFYRYFRERMIYSHAKPNGAHFALAELERSGKLNAVITQNIDGLHRKAGSKNVLELHGSALRAYCTRCGKLYPPSLVTDGEAIPICSCGSMIRPDIVLYGEGLDKRVFGEAERAVDEADVMIAAGTSLSVYPAASLVDMFKGKLIIINKSPTPFDHRASVVIRDPVSVVLSSVIQMS